VVYLTEIKPQTLKKALKKKGFELSERESDHEYFFFYENGEKTAMFTKFSRGAHGKKAMGDHLIHMVKEQMRFEKKEQLFSFTECTFTKEDYREMLIRKGLI